MKKKYILWTFLLVSLNCYSQDLTVDATYFDKDGIPYKIEQKYENENSVLYVKHTNDKSICVKRETITKEDTTIIQEGYLNIFQKRSKLDIFKSGYIWSQSTSINEDTVWISATDWNGLTADTMLVGEAAKDSWNFSKRIKTARVSDILDGKISVHLDSLIPNELFRAHYVNGLLFKIERLDHNGENHALITCELMDTLMICKRYFYRSTLELYQTDTIQWNKGTTEVRWVQNRLDWNEQSSAFYILDNATSTVTSDRTNKEVVYLEKNKIFENIIASGLLYDDVLSLMELRLFDRQKMVKATSFNGRVTTNDYTFDEEGRVHIQETFQDGELSKRIVYNYY